MYAYIDESGNTGKNMLDPEQPYFHMIAMVSPVDFDSAFRQRVSDIAKRVGVDHLHGSQLGVAGVEQVALHLIELLQFSQVQFVCACVNKEDIIAIHFFNEFFDPWENPAAPSHFYSVETLRFILLGQVARLLTGEDKRVFWDAYLSVPSPASELGIVSVIDNVLLRANALSDDRARQIIGETLSWAKSHVVTFGFWRFGQSLRLNYLPNVFVLPLVLTDIGAIADKHQTQVKAIVHDQQQQFGETLREWHSRFSGMEPKRIPLGDIYVDISDLRGSQFEMRDSKTSPGLQIVDVVLWAWSRIISEKQVGTRATALVAQFFLMQKAHVVSLSNMEEIASNNLAEFDRVSLSDEQMLGGRALMEYWEQQRQQRQQRLSEWQPRE